MGNGQWVKHFEKLLGEGDLNRERVEEPVVPRKGDNEKLEKLNGDIGRVELRMTLNKCKSFEASHCTSSSHAFLAKLESIPCARMEFRRGFLIFNYTFELHFNVT